MDPTACLLSILENLALDEPHWREKAVQDLDNLRHWLQHKGCAPDVHAATRDFVNSPRFNETCPKD